MPRDFSPYELAQLQRHQVDPASIAPDDERPVEYITGVVPFLKRELTVTSDTLIPRVETEELARRIIAHFTEPKHSHLSLADVGTGCGAIGLSIAWELSKRGTEVAAWLSDVSEAAVRVAEKNAQIENTTNAELHFLVSDLLTSFPPDQTFDLMIANLPYIPSERIAFLDKSVVDYEPHLALDGGPEGLTLVHRFLEQAIPRLNPSGEIWLEVDYTHSVAEVAGQWLTTQLRGEMILDEYSRNRFIRLIKTI